MKYDALKNPNCKCIVYVYVLLVTLKKKNNDLNNDACIGILHSAYYTIAEIDRQIQQMEIRRRVRN